VGRPPRGGAVAIVVVALAARAAAVELPVPGTAARVDASGYIDGLAVPELGGPTQRPQLLGLLRLDGRVTRALRLHLSLISRVGGPFEGAHAGIMDFDHEFQNHSPSGELNEAYAEYVQGDLQLRAGVQKFAWGKLDGAPPTDVLTPRDLHDPIVRDYEESKIGIPALQATYFLPALPSLDLSELRATLVYVPIAVPPRLALTQERWFPPSVNATSLIRFSAAEVTPVFDLPIPTAVRVPVDFHTLNKRPPRAFDDGAIAFRFGGTWRTVDWDVYHYSGAETAPDADLLVSVKTSRSFVDSRGILHLVAPADVHLRQAHDTIHMTGADWATAIGGATVRAELAWFVDRPYLRITSDLFSPQALAALPRAERMRIRDRVLAGKRANVPLGDLFTDRDSMEWGIGADYLVADFLPLLQVNQIVFLDEGPEQLYSDPETRLVASVRRRFLQDTLEAEVRGVYAIERAAWTIFPRITYRYGDHWRLRFGYLGIGGPLESYIGQFHRNDEFVLEARYSF